MTLVRSLPFLALLGCAATVPRAEFDAYRASFGVVRATTQDLVLAAKLASREESLDETNRDDVPTRLAKLEKRLDALDARLQALEVVDQFNAALLRLAEGASAEEVRAGLENLSSSLTSFVSGAASLIGKAVPYIGLISEGIAILEDLLRRSAFKEAVEAAEKPVSEILKLLGEDADDLHEIACGRLLLRSGREVRRVSDSSKRFRAVVNSLKDSDPLRKAIADHNAVRARVVLPDGSKLPAIDHAPAGMLADADEVALAALSALNGQAEAHAAAVETVAAEIVSHKEVIGEYKKVLSATQKAFVAVRMGLNGPRPLLLSYANDVRRFREVYLSYQEVRRR